MSLHAIRNREMCESAKVMDDVAWSAVECMYGDHRESSDSDSACLVGLGPELCRTYLVTY